MNLSSRKLDDVSQIFASEEGEWFIRGFIAEKPSRRNPASIGEPGSRYCSTTRSLSVNLSASVGTCTRKKKLFCIY